MNHPIPFKKYQGAGNDFVIIDNRAPEFLRREDTGRIRLMCDRRFGIGADGLMLLQNAAGYDFEMVYFNSDGRESTMCGNGGRCIAAFAQSLGITGDKCRFLAIDGPHEAFIPNNNWIELKLADVPTLEAGEGFYCLDTGSPHYVRFVQDIEAVDVDAEGKAVRYSEPFQLNGINVNFVMETPQRLYVATYERGVEGETLSCGTGVTAAALAHARKTGIQGYAHIGVHTKGGPLEVKFHAGIEGFSEIWLCGPAEEVFSGVY